MESITTTKTIPLSCDIKIAKRVLNLRAIEPLPEPIKHNPYVLLTKSCQDRIGAAFSIAIDLLSYIMNICSSLCWQSAHTVYCTLYFIRINRRAILHSLQSIRFLEYAKGIVENTAKTVVFTLYPFIRIIRRKKCFDETDDHQECNRKCNALSPQQTHQSDSQNHNDSNNNDIKQGFPNDDNSTAESDRITLEILWQPQAGTNITADVVFIHGLHGSSDSTWKQGEWVYKPQATNDNCIHIKHHDLPKNGETKCHQIEANTSNDGADNTYNLNDIDFLSQCWPKDWLPLDFPTARVCAMNYDTDPHLWRPIWYPKPIRSNLSQRAMKMIDVLVKYNIGENRPIIWVGHSKGGLYIKQIIVNAHEYKRNVAAAQWLWRSSRAVLFYSVPHRGSPLADLDVPLFTRSIEMIEIQKNFSTITDLHRRFVAMCRKGILTLDVFSFIEMKFTELSVFYLRIIGVDSGDPGIGGVCTVQLDHLDVCKPRNRNCFLYRQLANMIQSAIHTFNTLTNDHKQK